jgi:hypothetical protein
MVKGITVISLYGYLEKLPFGVSQARLPRPIPASRKNEKYSHLTNMPGFSQNSQAARLIFLFLELERKF